MLLFVLILSSAAPLVAQTISPGCTNPFACNYDVEAVEDDGSCEYVSCQWCNDSEACNYEGEGFAWTANPFLCEYIEDGACDCDGNVLDALGECGGACLADVDDDGICDSEDPCVGQIDDCGICNGPGAILDCGCFGIPVGNCDCDGNQLDAVGECGGECEADADQDGICDDVDPCVGVIDECGLCNGPGAVFECGCTVLLIGTCDCDGNELDALGVCGGDCAEDADGNGICDDEEVAGCTDPLACNYDPLATDNDGSCASECYGCMNALACNFDCLATVDDESCLLPEPGFDCEGNCWDLNEDGICDDLAEDLNVGPIVVELDTTFCGPNTPNGLDEFDPDGELEGYSSYLVYLELENPTDVLSALFSDTQVFEWAEVLQIDAPEGCWNPITSSMVMDATHNSVLWEIPSTSSYKYDTFWTIGMTSGDAEGQLPSLVSSPNFGGEDICEAEINNGTIFMIGQHANNVAGEDLRILIARVTTPGDFQISGNAQVFVEGDQIDPLLFPFHAYVKAQMPGCTDSTACNYDPSASLDDGTCLYFDAIDVCGGTCEVDMDGDGICDDVDDCVGVIDWCLGDNEFQTQTFCPVNPGDGTAMTVSFSGGFLETCCDFMTVYDGPDNTAPVITTTNGDFTGVSFTATNPSGCLTFELTSDGSVSCATGFFEPITGCGCSDIPEGDCDCDGNQLDAVGVCGGDCAADTDNDGICDDVDDCVGVFDECGICNGPGAIYECGCSDIPEGDCDCEGNQLDVVGVCGGTCIGDIEGDGICDCFEEAVEVPFGIWDTPGECNQLSLQVSGAPEEAAVEELFVNMEHSFLGDLDVIFICPSGVELKAAAWPGPGTFLGEPVDNDADPSPGVGYDYAWNADPTFGTWADEPAGPGGSLPSGSYTPVDDWSVLEECPVNGVWQLVICDFWASDNGFLFNWGVQIAGVDYPFTGMSDCVEGCTDALACNFNVFSSVDDGSCEYPGDACDDGDDTTINDVYTADCECVGEVDGLDEATALSWTLYPSPVRDVLNLRIEGGAWSGAIDGDVEVMVLGATGQVLRSERLAGRTQLDVSDLASGVYFLTLRSPAMASTTRRFVVAGGE